MDGSSYTNVACVARTACFDAVVRMVLGGLTAVALTLVIAFTAVELASQVGEIRGGGGGAVPASNDDLAELAARLISPPYPQPDGSTQTATLHPGALPPNAGFDLPIPPGSHLVGSVSPRFARRTVCCCSHRVRAMAAHVSNPRPSRPRPRLPRSSRRSSRSSSPQPVGRALPGARTRHSRSALGKSPGTATGRGC